MLKQIGLFRGKFTSMHHFETNIESFKKFFKFGKYYSITVIEEMMEIPPTVFYGYHSGEKVKNKKAQVVSSLGFLNFF